MQHSTESISANDASATLQTGLQAGLQVGSPNAGADYVFGPQAMLSAVVFGSAVAISFGLLSVTAIFWLLRADSEQVSFELGRVPLYSLLFLSLASISGPALYSTMKRLKWQWYAQAAMWSHVVAMAWWFTRKVGG